MRILVIWGSSPPACWCPCRPSCPGTWCGLSAPACRGWTSMCGTHGGPGFQETFLVNILSRDKSQHCLESKRIMFNLIKNPLKLVYIESLAFTNFTCAVSKEFKIFGSCELFIVLKLVRMLVCMQNIDIICLH